MNGENLDQFWLGRKQVELESRTRGHVNHVITRIAHWTNCVTSAMLLAIRLTETRAELRPLGVILGCVDNPRYFEVRRD